MKIFFLITKSEQGGAQTHVAQLVNYLRLRGHQVAVMSASGGWLEQEVARLNAKFYPNPTLANTANPFRLFAAARTLAQSISQFQPDLVTCHSTMAGLIGRWTLRNRIPTVFTAHGWSFTHGASRLRTCALPILERITAKFCTQIICVSSQDKQLALQHRIAPTSKLSVIYNGIASCVCQNTHEQTQAPSSSQMHVLFIGRLAHPKDPCLLVRALPDGCTLTIIGDGPQKNALTACIKAQKKEDRVTLTGTLDPHQIHAHLASAHIFVLPTHYEGFPYTILEAMAHALPVIASDVGGIKEVVDEDTGILIRPNNETQLRSALTYLQHHPEQRTYMGQAGKTKILTRFSLASMCQQTMNVYQETIKKCYTCKNG